MLRVKRFSKVTDKVKEIGKSIEHTVTHPKETGKKVVELLLPNLQKLEKQNKQLSQELLQHFLLVVHMYQGK